jgi:alpha/beta superfamily hydrolase
MAYGAGTGEGNAENGWVSDYMEFITHQLHAAERRPRHVVLLGVSEGAYVAVKVARSREEVTHLAIISEGAWTMRRSLSALADQEMVEGAWRAIAADANSITKSGLVTRTAVLGSSRNSRVGWSSEPAAGVSPQAARTGARSA